MTSFRSAIGERELAACLRASARAGADDRLPAGLCLGHDRRQGAGARRLGGGEGRAMLRFDYSGCGRSAGEFEAQSLAQWRDDALGMIDEVAQGPVVLVGSSMGGWLMLLAALARPEQVKGLIGVAAAPDFTGWGYSEEEKLTILRDGRIEQANPYGDAPTVTSRAFWESGEALRLTHAPIAIDCPVRLLHGQADADVPWAWSLRLDGFDPFSRRADAAGQGRRPPPLARMRSRAAAERDGQSDGAARTRESPRPRAGAAGRPGLDPHAQPGPRPRPAAAHGPKRPLHQRRLRQRRACRPARLSRPRSPSATAPASISSAPTRRRRPRRRAPGGSKAAASMPANASASPMSRSSAGARPRRSMSRRRPTPRRRAIRAAPISSSRRAMPGSRPASRPAPCSRSMRRWRRRT